jgi:hypothetical protein
LLDKGKNPIRCALWDRAAGLNEIDVEFKFQTEDRKLKTLKGLHRLIDEALLKMNFWWTLRDGD